MSTSAQRRLRRRVRNGVRTVLVRCFLRTLRDPRKSQSDHYHDLLLERKDNPCTPEQEKGIDPMEGRGSWRTNYGRPHVPSVARMMVNRSPVVCSVAEH